MAKNSLKSIVEVSPSLLAIVEGKNYNDSQIFYNLKKAIDDTPSAGLYHIDIMEKGKLVSVDTIFKDIKYIEYVKEIINEKNTGQLLDIHLMVDNPITYIEKLKSLADFLTFHIEAVSNINKIVELEKKIRDYGIKAGVALNPKTRIKKLESIIDYTDLVLFMSVIPGKCGQVYIPSVTNKIKKTKQMILDKKANVIIGVDGGIKESNSYVPINAGADFVVSGSGIFGCEDKNIVIKNMKEVILIGSDHGGFVLKGKIMDYLNNKAIAYHNMGSYSTESCDHPIIARSVAEPISKGEYKRGVLICGSGIGMSIGANRFNDVRATILYNNNVAKLSREHNNSNIAVFGEREMNHDDVIKSLDIWLNTEHLGGKYNNRNKMFDRY